MASVLASVRSRFAHLAGRAAPDAAPEAPPAPPPAPETSVIALSAEEQEEEARKAEEGEDEARKSRKARRAKRAKKNDEDEDEDEDEDDAGDDEEDGGDDDKMEKAEAAGHALALDAAFRRGARAQRRRCAAIFSSPAAAQNLTMAATLAFETSLTADKAQAVLEQAPATSKPGLAARMAATPQPRIAGGAAPVPSGPAKVAQSWDRAMAEFGSAPKK